MPSAFKAAHTFCVCLLFSIIFSPPMTATASDIELLKDINDKEINAYPRYITQVGNDLYFSLNDGNNGDELWKSDGTVAGTVLVKDINPGSGSAYPNNLTNVNGTLFFVANNGSSGSELWKSDGTAAGTVLVKDIRAGTSSSYLDDLTNVNGTLYFKADDGSNGKELWKSDGTAAGTVMVKDIKSGSASPYLDELTNVNGILFFKADDDSSGNELWKSDGTTAGTVMVKDIRAGSSGSNPDQLTNFNGTLYFEANDGSNGYELWKSDGTAAGTVMVKDIRAGGNSSPDHLINVNGTLYFEADDGSNGDELWKSDGTAAGTVMVKDIRAGTSNASLDELTNVNGTLYFEADDGISGRELWKSDGTAAGTVLVKDIKAGSENSFLDSMTNVNGTLYFSANDGLSGIELWKSDGTEAGTVRVKDIYSGSDNSNPDYLTNFNGTLYFSANDGLSGIELWKSDGTTAGTVQVANINLITYGSNPRGLINVNGTLYFEADDGNSGKELWKSDGSEAGTVLVKDIQPGSSGSIVLEQTSVGDILYFTGYVGSTGYELWKSDGTEAGTMLVKDIQPGSDGSTPRDLTSFNGILYFRADDGSSGEELWKSDGTEAGTVMVKDINAGAGDSFPDYLTPFNGSLYFRARDNINGIELWKTDGTTGGTVLVKDIIPGINSGNPAPLININGTLFFTAHDSSAGTELWKSDGTAAGTVMVKDIQPGSGGSSPSDLTNVNGTLYFKADDGNSGYELWKSDGTAAGTVLVKDIQPGSGYSYPDNLTNVNGTLYFEADDGSSGYELWKSDGTAAGTVLVKDIVTGSSGSQPDNLINANGTLYFRVYTGGSYKLWKSDGTDAGTVSVAESSYEPYAVMGKELYFSSPGSLVGKELHFINLNQIPSATDKTLSLDEDGTHTFKAADFGYSDADSDPLVSLKITQLETAGTLSWNGSDVALNQQIAAADINKLTFVPELNANGSSYANFKFTANDGEDDSLTYTITFDVAAVNDAPSISGSPATSVLEGVGYQFSPVLADVENDGMTVTAINLPGWLGLNAATGVIMGTPQVGDYGRYSNIQLKVSDGHAVSTLAPFTIDVVGDNDLDGIADSVDPDDDNDGMSDSFETAHGFDPRDSSDAAGDADNDGLSNLDEALQNGDPNKDDQAPVIAAPQPITLNATGLLTRLPVLTPPIATDGLDGKVTVSLEGKAPDSLTPGRHALTWLAKDAAGNRAEATQRVDIHPLISLSSDQVTGEGANTQFRVLFNGVAPEYPVTVQYRVAGTADSHDHNLVAGSVTFNEGETEQSVAILITDDGILEASETLEVSLTESDNVGIKRSHTITIVEENVAPQLSLSLTQDGRSGMTVTQDGGIVSFSAAVNDPNPNDTLAMEWRFPLGVSSTTVTELQRTINPAELEPGSYSVVVSATDNGAPVLGNEVQLSFYVIASAPSLSATEDSDGDGISDADEGWADDDQDGQPNYLDGVSLPNVLNEVAGDGQKFLIEAEPGVKLQLGKRALATLNGGAKVDNTQLPLEQALPEDSITNFSGYFDFRVNDLPVAGQSVNIVIPQRQPVPENAVYRKFNEVWFTFVEDANNTLMSAPGEQGVCPPPQSADYRPGLNAGDWCVQLTIEDGGPNDVDSLANGSVEDPGGVGVPENNEEEVDANSGNVDTPDSGGNITNSADMVTTTGGGGSADWALVLMLLSALGYRLVHCPQQTGYAALILLLLTLPLQGLAAEGETLTQQLKERSYLELGLYQARGSQSSKDFTQGMASAGVAVDLRGYDADRTAYQVALGYSYLDWSAIEVGFMDLGEVKADFAINGSVVSDAALKQAINDHYPVTGQGVTLGNRFEAFPIQKLAISGELGLFFWEGDIDVEGRTVESQYDNEQDLYFGAGIRYQFLQQLGLGFKWRRVFVADQKVDLIGGNIVVSF